MWETAQFFVVVLFLETERIPLGLASSELLGVYRRDPTETMALYPHHKIH